MDPIQLLIYVIVIIVLIVVVFWLLSHFTGLYIAPIELAQHMYAQTGGGTQKLL